MEFRSKDIAKIHHTWLMRYLCHVFLSSKGQNWNLIRQRLSLYLQLERQKLDCLERVFLDLTENPVNGIIPNPNVNYNITFRLDDPIPLDQYDIIVMRNHVIKTIRHYFPNMNIENVQLIIENSRIMAIRLEKIFDSKTNHFSVIFWRLLDEFHLNIPDILRIAFEPFHTHNVFYYRMDIDVYDLISDKMHQSFSEKDESFQALQKNLKKNFLILLNNHFLEKTDEMILLTFYFDSVSKRSSRQDLKTNLDRNRKQITRELTIYFTGLENDVNEEAQKEKKRRQRKRKKDEAKKKRIAGSSVVVTQEKDTTGAQHERIRLQQEKESQRLRRIQQEKRAKEQDRLRRIQQDRLRRIQQEKRAKEILQQERMAMETKKKEARKAAMQKKKAADFQRKEKERLKSQARKKQIEDQKAKKEKEKPYKDAVRYLRKNPEMCKYLDVQKISDDELLEMCSGSLAISRARPKPNPEKALAALDVLQTRHHGSVDFPLYYQQHFDLIDKSPQRFFSTPSLVGRIRENQQKMTKYLDAFPLAPEHAEIIIAVLRVSSHEQRKRLLTRIIYSDSISLLDVLHHLRPKPEPVIVSPIKKAPLDSILHSITELQRNLFHIIILDPGKDSDKIQNLPENIKSMIPPTSLFVVVPQWILDYPKFPEIDSFLKTLYQQFTPSWETIILCNNIMYGYFRLSAMLYDQYGILLVIKGGQAVRNHTGIPTNDIDLCITSDLEMEEKKLLGSRIAQFFRDIPPLTTSLRDIVHHDSFPPIPVFKVRYQSNLNKSLLEINYDGCMDLTESDIEISKDGGDTAIIQITLEYYLKEQTRALRDLKQVMDVPKINYYRTKTLEKITDIFENLLFTVP